MTARLLLALALAIAIGGTAARAVEPAERLADPADPTATAVLAAGRRKRNRRSLSETRPPKAPNIAPNQIQGTSGL